MGKKKEKVIQRVQNVIPIQKEKQKNILMINIPSCIFFLSWSVFEHCANVPVRPVRHSHLPSEEDVRELFIPVNLLNPYYYVQQRVSCTLPVII